MKKILILLTFNFLFTGFVCYAQQKQIDSLKQVLKTAKEDTNKVKTLNTLCERLNMEGSFDTVLILAKQALQLAKKTNFKKQEARAYGGLGNAYYGQGDLPEALKNHLTALKIREEIGDKKGISNSYSNIGNVYNSQSNYPEALKNLFASLKIREELGFKPGIAGCYLLIGNVYQTMGNYPEALKNQFACLKIVEEMGDKFGTAESYNNIGLAYEYLNNLPEAIKYYTYCFNIGKELNSNMLVGTYYNNIANVYIKQHKAAEAKNLLLKAYTMDKDRSYQSKQYSYERLAKADSALGNYKEAMEYYKLYIVYRDSMLNEESTKKTLQTQMQYEFDKKEIATKAEQDKLDAINAEEKQKQRVIIYAVAGLLILVGVFAVFMYNRFRITQKQKAVIEEQKQKVDEAYTKLEEKNKEVMDSIHYAKRIQTALITSEKSIANSLNRLIRNN
jgi:tetratricopeptide (TPR) repeat protein